MQLAGTARRAGGNRRPCLPVHALQASDLARKHGQRPTGGRDLAGACQPGRRPGQAYPACWPALRCSPSRPPPMGPGSERSCVSRKAEPVAPGAGGLGHAEPAAGAMRMTRADDPPRSQRGPRQPDPIRERDRTAAELHDQVIKAIFAVGLHLQDTAAITVDPLVRCQVEKALSDLDDVIRLIRNTAFSLTGLSSARPPRAEPRDLAAGAGIPRQHAA